MNITSIARLCHTLYAALFCSLYPLLPYFSHLYFLTFAFVSFFCFCFVERCHFVLFFIIYRQIIKIKDVLLHNMSPTFCITYNQNVFKRRTLPNREYDYVRSDRLDVDGLSLIYLVITDRDDITIDTISSNVVVDIKLTYVVDLIERQIKIGTIALKLNDFYDEDCRLRTKDLLRKSKRDERVKEETIDDERLVARDNATDLVIEEIDLVKEEEREDAFVGVVEELLALTMTHFKTEITFASGRLSKEQILNEIVNLFHLNRIDCNYYAISNVSDYLDHCLIEFVREDEQINEERNDREEEVPIRIYTR